MRPVGFVTGTGIRMLTAAATTTTTTISTTTFCPGSMSLLQRQRGLDFNLFVLDGAHFSITWTRVCDSARY